MNRGCNFDSGLCARPPNRDRAEKQRGQEINEGEHNQKLQTDGTAIPHSMQHALPRRGCSQRSGGGSELRANDLPPCGFVQLRRSLRGRVSRQRSSKNTTGRDRLDVSGAAKTHRFRQLGHIQSGTKVRFSSRLFHHSPMNKMPPKGTCSCGRLGFIIPPTSKREDMMAWTTPVLVEICVGLEINGYLPPEF